MSTEHVRLTIITILHSISLVPTILTATQGMINYAYIYTMIMLIKMNAAKEH